MCAPGTAALDGFEGIDEASELGALRTQRRFLRQHGSRVGLDVASAGVAMRRQGDAKPRAVFGSLVLGDRVEGEVVATSALRAPVGTHDRDKGVCWDPCPARVRRAPGPAGRSLGVRRPDCPLLLPCRHEERQDPRSVARIHPGGQCPDPALGPETVTAAQERQTVRERVLSAGSARAALRGLLAALVVVLPLLGQEAPNPAEGLILKEIRFEGLKRTQEYVVRRELVSRVGEPYRDESVAKEKTRLERLDIFVDIQVEAAVEGTEVILTYRFVEILQFIPSLSVQITDENGISVGVGIKVPNVRGRDVSFSGRIMGGGSALGQIVVQNPWFIGNRVGYSFEYYYRDRQNLVADFLETSHELVLDVNAALSEYWRLGGNFNYMDVRSDRDGVTLSPDNQDQVTRFGLYLAYDRKDAHVGTHEGWYGEVRLSQEFRIFENSSNTSPSSTWTSGAPAPPVRGPAHADGLDAAHARSPCCWDCSVCFLSLFWILSNRSGN